jgi:uncharacterized protein
MPEKQHTNRLIGEKSPYLLQHAHNPVDWFPWGEDAFAAARRLGRPIFLSIGYSTCHWCHVMERESFENPAIAALLNRYFVSIKVDREERPDVDRAYMMFVQSTTGAGGWPMSVFLTPDLKPFLGGTYYPPEDRYNRPGFASLLKRLGEIWEQTPKKIQDQGERFTAAIQDHLAQSHVAETTDPQWSHNAFTQIRNSFDSEEGGFTAAPKFPRPALFSFLLRYWKKYGNASALDMTVFTLKKMAAGGLYDHIGGGFHRYSVDEYWHVPHFEKMLYDQAQLIVAYTEAFLITRDPFFEQIVRETIDYVLRDLRSEAGGFYSAEDADSLPTPDSPEKKEGAFYVWGAEEIDRVLGDSTVFKRTYGIENAGNVSNQSDPHGGLHHQNVLIRQNEPDLVAKLTGHTSEQIETLLKANRLQLKTIRDRRPRPHLDDKIVTAWNGMMISALAKATQVFGDYLAAAQKAASFIKKELYPKRLLRSFREGAGKTFAFAEDYAFLIQGLLDLYETDFDESWLQWAGELQVQMSALFSDSRGGFYNTEEGDPDLLFRMRDDHDGAEPSANSIAATNMVRLGRVFGKPEFQEAALRIARSFGETMNQTPHALPALLSAMDATSHPPSQIVIVSEQSNKESNEDEFLKIIRNRFLPNTVILKLTETTTWLREHIPPLQHMKPIDGKTTIYLCSNFTCDLPITDPATLVSRLDTI